VVYIGDLGGNLWKWVVKPLGDDPINCEPSAEFGPIGPII